MQNKKVLNYTLLHQLGVGGMAEVWYAENEIGKRAAVKVLLPKFCADEAIVARFQNEARVMVQLEHPNIRQAYDYTTVDDRPCMVMEYLEGEDLSKRMKHGERFTDDQLQKWWNQIADALNYTHAEGIVHRDLKPSNIFVDKKGNVKLLDFGIAKIKESISMTQTGAMMGTLMYMSPEQVMDTKHIDYKTDLYSIAVTFVHLLMGEAPYDTTTSNDFEIRENIVRHEMDLSRLPREWQNFLRPYLAKKPDDRPALTAFRSLADAPTVLQATPVSPAVAEETVVAGRTREEETVYAAEPPRKSSTYVESKTDRDYIEKGNEQYNEDNCSKAVEYWRIAADNGSPRALHNLAVDCLRRYVDSENKRDIETAKKYLEMAIQKNYGPAYRLMGLIELANARNAVEESAVATKSMWYFKQAFACGSSVETANLITEVLLSSDKLDQSNLSLIDKILYSSEEHSYSKFFSGKVDYLVVDYSAFESELRRYSGTTIHTTLQAITVLDELAEQSGYNVHFEELSSKELKGVQSAQISNSSTCVKVVCDYDPFDYPLLYEGGTDFFDEAILFDIIAIV